MNQVPSHSQTPDFGHIPSTGILYQQPPSTEQLTKSNKRNKFRADAKDAFLIIGFIGAVIAGPFTVKSCSEEVDRQTIESIKFQTGARS